MSSYKYAGSELDVFWHAQNWKAYLAGLIGDCLRGRVLEVGGGIGAATRALCDGRQSSWTCLEPDDGLRRSLLRNVSDLPIPIEVIGGTTSNLTSASFDCVLYIDVLEHIEDDVGEMARAADLLKGRGSIVVMSPAHQMLFSEFDRQIGHLRRYDRGMMRALTPPGARLVRLAYLDSAGFLLSLANRLVLRSGRPTERQIRIWDSWFVGLSRHADRLLGWRFGKSILGVWRKDDA